MGRKLEGQLEFDFMKDINFNSYKIPIKEGYLENKFAVIGGAVYTLGMMWIALSYFYFEPIKNYIENIL